MLGAEELSGSLEENITLEGFSWIKKIAQYFDNYLLYTTKTRTWL